MTREIDSSTVQSIKDRLQNEAEKRDVTNEMIAVRYGLERFLHRLSRSQYSEQFLLKGATLFLPWEGDFHRPTRDIDFSGSEVFQVEELEAIVSEVCEIQPDKEDGVVFFADSVEAEKIREGQAYEGIRIKFDAELGSHELRLQVDVGLWDAVEPPPVTITYPSLLDHPPTQFPAYRRETVVAEKLQFIVEIN